MSIGPPKEAALYFDRVFPFDMGESMLKYVGVVPGPVDPNAVPFANEQWDEGVLTSLLGSRERVRHYIEHATLICMTFMLRGSEGNPSWMPTLLESNVVKAFFEISQKFTGVDLTEALTKASKGNFDLTDFLFSLTPTLDALMAKSGFSSTPSWKSGSWVSPKHASDNASTTLADKYVISVKGLSLVDVDALPWATVVEMRRDRHAMADLRNFRLFFTESFEGKEPAYITDKLLSLHDRQKEVARIWGLKTAQRSMSAIFDQATIYSTSAAAIAMTFAGGPLAAVGSLLIPLGKTALEIFKISHEAKAEQIDRPLKYLTRLEELQSGPSHVPPA